MLTQLDSPDFNKWVNVSSDLADRSSPWCKFDDVVLLSCYLSLRSAALDGQHETVVQVDDVVLLSCYLSLRPAALDGQHETVVQGLGPDQLPRLDGILKLKSQ